MTYGATRDLNLEIVSAEADTIISEHFESGVSLRYVIHTCAVYYSGTCWSGLSQLLLCVSFP